MIYTLATEEQYELRRPLLDILPKNSRGAEIGVWSGDFSQKLINELHPKELSLVDPWKFRTETEFQGSGYAGSLAKSQDDMDELYSHVSERFSADDRVVIYRLESADAASRFSDDSLDWVYIDGDHRYSSVISDLRIWQNKVKPAGLITGDDYGATGWWGDGVTRAVDEIVTEGNLTFVLQLNNQFALEKIRTTSR